MQFNHLKIKFRNDINTTAVQYIYFCTHIFSKRKFIYPILEKVSSSLSQFKCLNIQSKSVYDLTRTKLVRFLCKIQNQTTKKKLSYTHIFFI